MHVTMCDWCGHVINKATSHFKITYETAVNIAEDWEPKNFVKKPCTETLDLCEECAVKIYKQIKGYDPPRKLL